jgi:hypothetical protein
MQIINPAGAIIALGACATVAIVVVSIGQAYVKGLELQKRAREPQMPPDVQDRMSRIEQAVDAIAIEVERMSEGQRFTTRLLAERFGEGSTADAAGRRSGSDGNNGAGGTNGR